MLRRKGKLFTGLLLISCFILVGCFDDRTHLFEEKVLEWEPPNPATNALSGKVKFKAGETGSKTYNLRIRYAGKHQAKPIKAVFTVDSDATEGTHYTISSKVVTVPEASSFSEEINIELIGGAMADGDSYDMILTITEDSDVKPMENYKNFVLSVEKSN